MLLFTFIDTVRVYLRQYRNDIRGTVHTHFTETLAFPIPTLLTHMHTLPESQTRARAVPLGGGGVIAHNAKQSDLPRPFLPPHPPSRRRSHCLC